jgi:hypothetical protein
VSRLAFYYDTYTRSTYVYFDAAGTGAWKWIDLSRPLVLFALPNRKWEVAVGLPGLEEAVRAFAELPKDPRAYPEAERRFIALRDRIRQFRGTWYRDGDPAAVARVEADETSSGARFYRPGEKGVFQNVWDPWRMEAGSRPPVPDDDGSFAYHGIRLSADGQVIWFEKGEAPWYRTPRGK